MANNIVYQHSILILGLSCFIFGYYLHDCVFLYLLMDPGFYRVNSTDFITITHQTRALRMENLISIMNLTEKNSRGKSVLKGLGTMILVEFLQMRDIKK